MRGSTELGGLCIAFERLRTAYLGVHAPASMPSWQGITLLRMTTAQRRQGNYMVEGTLPGSREKTSGSILRIVASAPWMPNRRHAISTAMASCGHKLRMRNPRA